MRIAARLKHAAAIARQDGIVRCLKYAADRTVEQWYDHRLGISTAGVVLLESLSITNEDAKMYTGSSYPGFFRTLKRSGIPYDESTFVDYGCGMGRIIIAAATFPFKRVIGIELSSILAEKARENLRSAERHFQCRDVNVVVGNATQWSIPDHVNVFHLFNPFGGQTLRTVTSEIARSLTDHPRKAWILYGLPREMDSIMRSGQPIPKVWQTSTQDVIWPFSDAFKRYRIYRLDSRVTPHPTCCVTATPRR